MEKNLEQIDQDGDEIKIIDWYFPENDESRMAVTINLNGYTFEGIVYNPINKEVI